MSEEGIKIIGIGSSSSITLEKDRIVDIYACDILIGAQRFLDQFDGIQAEKVAITSDNNSVYTVCSNNKEKKIVILASGDPNLFGVTDFVFKNLTSRKIKVYPNISSMQMAFAAARVTMNEALFISAYGRDMDTIVSHIANNKKVGIFSTDGDTPHKIVELLAESFNGEFDIYICEDLGYESERVTKTNIEDIRRLTFSPLNIIILVRKGEVSVSKGYPIVPGTIDDDLLIKDNLIIKPEIRVVNISKLKIKPESIIWDIGAGSGALSIEVASFAIKGTVFAIEKDTDQTDFLHKNITNSGLKNIKVIFGEAPSSMETSAMEESPDRIFIGGNSGRLKDIIYFCKDRIQQNGIIIINAKTLNVLIEGTAILKETGFSIEVFTVNISNTKELNGNHLFKSASPVYIISGVKA